MEETEESKDISNLSSCSSKNNANGPLNDNRVIDNTKKINKDSSVKDKRSNRSFMIFKASSSVKSN